MIRWYHILIVALLVLGGFYAVQVRDAVNQSITDFEAKNANQTTNGLYPDKSITTGKYDTLKVSDLTQSYNGQTYSQSHRNVTTAEKQQVYQEYGISYPQPAGAYEVDHFYPMCAGGSNDIKNLWLQPAHVTVFGKDYGFHTKDKLEAWVCEEIKAGKLDPAVAFAKITTDWVSYYNQTLGNSLGAIETGGFTGDDYDQP